MESGSESSARISVSVTWYSSTQVVVPSVSVSNGSSSPKSMGRVSCRKLRLTASIVATPFSYLVEGSTWGTPVAASPSVAMIATRRSGLTVRARLRGLSCDQPSGTSCSRSSRTVREYRAMQRELQELRLEPQLDQTIRRLITVEHRALLPHPVPSPTPCASRNPPSAEEQKREGRDERRVAPLVLPRRRSRGADP